MPTAGVLAGRSNSARVRIHAELRNTAVEYGLASLARSRLRWEIVRGEEARKRTDEPRARQQQLQQEPDPRSQLGKQAA